MTSPALQVGVDPLVNWFAEVVGMIPELLVAVLLVVVAYLAGNWAGGKGQALAKRMSLGEAVMETPLAVLFRDATEVGDVLETATRALFVLFGVVVGASMAGFNQIADIGRYVLQYAPSVVGAVAIVLVGFVVAGYVARSVRESAVVGGTAFTPVVATTMQAIIYFVSVTLALDALGYSTAILNTLAQAVAIGVGLGVALAIGIGVGMGSQDYVEANLDDWLDQDREPVTADD